MHQQSYLRLEDLFQEKHLNYTCKHIVEIALGLNDDPEGDDVQILVKHNFAKNNYRQGMTFREALEIRRGQKMSQSEIEANMEKEKVLAHLLHTPHIRLYQHGMTVETAEQAIQNYYKAIQDRRNA